MPLFKTKRKNLVTVIYLPDCASATNGFISLTRISQALNAWADSFLYNTIDDFYISGNMVSVGFAHYLTLEPFFESDNYSQPDKF